MITRNRDYRAEGAIVVHDLRDALDKAHAMGETECFIIGGGKSTGTPWWATWWTRNTSPTWTLRRKGMRFYPDDAWAGWSAEELRAHEADEKHDHAYVIKRYERPTT